MLDRARLLLSLKNRQPSLYWRGHLIRQAPPCSKCRIHEDEFDALISGRMDPGTIQSVSISPPDRITFFRYGQRDIFEVSLRYIYNVGKVWPSV